jgi:hypothetical protein
VAGATGFAGLATVSDLRAPGADPVATARQLLGLVTTGALAGDECRLRGEALRRLSQRHRHRRLPGFAILGVFMVSGLGRP